MQSHTDLTTTVVRSRMRQLQEEAGEARLAAVRRVGVARRLRTWLGIPLVGLRELIAADRGGDPCGDVQGHPA